MPTSAISPIKPSPKAPKGAASHSVVRDLAAKEFVFAVVGPVGSGTSEIAEALEGLLKSRDYEVSILKARDEIEQWAAVRGREIPKSPKLEQTRALQDAGDALREESGDNAAVALGMIRRVREERARQTGVAPEAGVPVEPDGKLRAFILDSLRHPHEVALLRGVYQEAFCLVGVVCHEDERYQRLHEEKYRDAGADDLKAFMRRDENAPERHGQKVSDTFHLSDYFVDNTVRRFVKNAGGKEEENPKWDVT